ncbi:transketolase [Heliophilum fasciatum]|uniref:Transketolase n=1 Tax=Heliophilum fasciatum TaxID=35700 RepID=A0A4R2RW66_9FIRM|nr:1-deoxy-D-xylulose-5-phosphate synthase N-terminal domain-containing protein [Heliophilum fasciatum]MCW2276859.1 transketolase [Heliophilum fasciatum]TCP68680.1 transketolase [Heliophilum fasciatum]
MTQETHHDGERWQRRAQQVARGIRQRVLAHTVNNNGGYLSQACSAAEILAALYTKIMNLAPVDKPLVPPPFAGVPGPDNPNSFTGAIFHGPKASQRDRFILSPAQYALVVYAALIEVGRMDEQGLDHFNQDGSTVEMIGAEHSPGMEVMTGSLGQGLSQAAGIAMARKLRGETGRVWVFVSDGELQSGQNWEALQAMAHHRLDNMGIYVDVNKQQCDGPVCSVMNMEPLHERLASFGARVFVVDGHDLDALAAPAELEPDGRPLVVLADTDPCRGLPILQTRIPKLHYVRFVSGEERERYRQVLADFSAEA